MRDKKIDTYSVGYGKPPKNSRFKKGQSGNPKGRPRGSQNTATIMMKALKETVVMTENGRRRKITMKEAIIKQAITKAASGEFRHIKLLLDLIPIIEARAEEAQAAIFTPTPLPEGIDNLFGGAFKIIAEHGALPPGMMYAPPISDTVVPSEKRIAPTIPPASGKNANGARAKPPQEDPPF
jgi:hypothetical protein